MVTAWQEIGGKRYYFGENGAATIGWYQEGEYNYYFLSDGSAAVGPTEIDGETHFFTPKGMEVILVNAAHAVIAVQAIICKHSLTPDVTEVLNEWILIQGMSLPQGGV